MSSADKYTDPELREEVKEEVKAGDKGGAPGQWSARKAQMMASEYKKRGGGYTTDKETGQDESQRHLSEWGEEEWQTKEGSGSAKQDDGTEKRYLPKKAWEQMTEAEKEATEEKKEEGGKEGKQYVENTEAAKQARANASAQNGKDKNGSGQDEEEEEEEKEEEGRNGANGHNGTANEKGGAQPAHQNGDHKLAEKNGDEDLEEVTARGDADPQKEEDAQGEEDEEYVADEDEPEDEEEDEDGGEAKEPKTSRKRSAPTDSSAGASKKQKSSTTGEVQKTNEPPAPPGSVDRLPKEGQKVTWHSLAGYVHGTVVEIANEEKEVEGKKVKGAEGDPRVVLKTENGKVAVHKPEALFFDDE